jgi:hypothetical protein
MNKDELIDLYLRVNQLHAHSAYYRRYYIKSENFEMAMYTELDMHFLQDLMEEVGRKLCKKGWYYEAIDEASV